MPALLPFIDLFLHAVLAYLLGSVSGSLLVGRLRGVDIRRHGSGNAGGTNAFRTQGLRFALLVVIIDIGKGVLAVLWLPHLPLGLPALAAHWLSGSCTVAAVIGHIWPLYHGFRGGKGGATAVGAMTALSPLTLPVLLVIWIITIILTGYVGLATILAALSLWPALLWLGPQPLPGGYTLAGLALTALVFYAHRSNVQRLLQGNEHRFEKARLLHRWLRRSS